MSLRNTRLLAGLVVLLACAAAPAAHASDGTYTQILCANPDTGRGVVASDGTLPDGTTNPSNMQWAGISAALSRCTGVIGGGDGVPVTTGAGWTSSEANKGSALSYRVPSGIAFRGGTIYRYGTMSGRFSWTVSRSGQWNQIFGSPRDEICTWGEGCTSRGTPSAPWVDANRVTIGQNDVGGFDLSVLCDIPQGWSCTADGSQTVRIYGGKLALEDASAPEVSGVTGSLASDGTLAGVEDIDFSATDVGSGLYRVRLLVDGAPRLSQIVHANGGRCADANPANGDNYEFAHQQPCRPSASVSTSFDTRSLPEGQAVVKVVVEDAGGNAATVVNRSVRIDNVPPPSLVTAPGIDGLARKGSGLALVGGAWDDHGVDGSPDVAHQWQRCSADGSSCNDVPGADGLTLVLGADDVGRRIRVVETASNSEGSVQAVSPLTDVVTLENGTLPPDRDGVDNDGDGQVDEPGESGPAPPAPGPGSGSGSGSGGQTDNPSGLSGSRVPSGTASSGASPAGTVNGEGASPRARLTVGFRGRSGSTHTVPFGRTVTIAGRLVDEHGRPIRNAIVDVTSVASVRGAAAVGAQPAVTGADGAFTYRVQARSASRTLRFVYRYLRAGEIVSDASLQLRVRAAVKLAVRLKGAVVRYSGRVVSGPMPRSGKLVVLQGRVTGARWQTFASRRARGRGTFRGLYRLKVRRPGVRLQFRARVVAEAGWPYLEGTSRAVTRRVK